MFLFSIKFQILSCLPQLEIVKWISGKKQSTLLTTVHIHKSLANCTMDNLLWAVCANWQRSQSSSCRFLQMEFGGVNINQFNI